MRGGGFNPSTAEAKKKKCSRKSFRKKENEVGQRLGSGPHMEGDAEGVSGGYLSLLFFLVLIDRTGKIRSNY